MSTGQRSRRLFALAGALALFCAAPVAAQQSYTIFGRVLDPASGQGLAGAQVSIQGTNAGALTEENGNYTIQANLTPGSYTLEFTFIGRAMATRAITLGSDRTVNVPSVELKQQALSLDAVVVTGTAAPTAKRALGNSVSTVGQKEVSESPSVTLDQALQGKVAGAVITSNTGTPGGGVSVRLRGTSSIIGGAEPLYIVDGVIIDNNGDQQINFGYRSNPSNRLADLSPDDIDHIEILKGAAAAALYGSRANNGVVQIFTKRGTAGKPQINASTRFSFGSLPTRLPFAMTPKDENGNPVTRYDPQDLIFRNSVSNDTYASVAGGSTETKYYMSANYTNQQGIMKGSDYQKTNVRLNLDENLADWIKLSAGANYIRSQNNLVINGENGTGGLLTAIVFTPTTVNLAERNPETGELVNQAFVFPNPLEVISDWSTPQDVNRFIGSFQAHATAGDNLTLDYRLGYDNYGMSTSQFIPRGSSAAPQGSSTDVNRNSLLVNNDLIASYVTDPMEALRLTTSAGMNHTYNKVENLNAAASDLSPLTELVRGAVQSASQSKVETATLGFFGQEQLAWKNRFFLTGALRWDASSTFGTDQRWQVYPKVSGSWVVSDENFFKNSGLSSFLTQFRLRAALGYAGNQPPLDYAYARIARYGTDINVDRLGLIPLASGGNPDLKPERQREFEVGFDASALDDRIGLTFTYYNQYTKDLLLTRPFAPSTGVGSILDNVGELSNRGIELQLKTVNYTNSNFGWNTTFIYSRNRNKVEKLYGDPFTVGYNNRVEEGQPLGVFYMSAYERDANGNIVTDSIGPVRAAESKIVGNPWPTFTASMNNEFTVGKSLTASFLLDGSFGQDVWNQTRRIMDIFGAGPLYDRLLKGEITPAYRSRVQGIFEAYLEDATYVKLREASLRYTLPAGWTSGFGLAQVQLELLGRDLYTWTDYSGYDPEVNMFGLSTVARGVDFAVYPHPRTFSLGLKVRY